MGACSNLAACGVLVVQKFNKVSNACNLPASSLDLGHDVRWVSEAVQASGVR